MNKSLEELKSYYEKKEAQRIKANAYYRNKYNISNPNIITLKKVHPAFDKGCHYFNINVFNDF